MINFEEIGRQRARAVHMLKSRDLMRSEWSAPRCSFFAVVLPGQALPFVVRYFDERGFSGHVETNDPVAELLSVFGSSIEEWTGMLEYVSPEWPQVDPVAA